MGEHGRLQLVLLGHDPGAVFLDPAVEAAVIDIFVHEDAQQIGGLAKGEASGGRHGLLADPGVVGCRGCRRRTASRGRENRPSASPVCQRCSLVQPKQAGRWSGRHFTRRWPSPALPTSPAFVHRLGGPALGRPV